MYVLVLWAPLARPGLQTDLGHRSSQLRRKMQQRQDRRAMDKAGHTPLAQCEWVSAGRPSHCVRVGLGVS